MTRAVRSGPRASSRVARYSDASRAYGALRAIVEDLGGTMFHVKKGYRYGAWIVTINRKETVFEGVGNKTLPALDQYYKPRRGIRSPKDWDDYTAELLDGADELWRQALTYR